ncbi:hypothetical protein Pla111_33820 [Botrimarina hoheduenensis]|uniref:Uncharacterized protein n=2 Tax=Botrimarina hoheduenensis TaxID=2528000 RepID=A0A5C5VQ50_9BACT|nr:hypothetical protein Pla111_33820 [Botrimarina hoheduenensis]
MMILGLMAGCSTSKTSVPNPFLTTDRVAPPATHLAPAPQAGPYYSAPAGAPLYGAPAASPYASPNSFGTSPSAFGTPPAAPITPAPAPLGQIDNRSPVASLAAGDAVAVPGDGAPLRFGSAIPRSAQPISPNSIAQAPATASGWIAGSAPVRSVPSYATAAPTTRLPQSASPREPVSLAALGGDNRGQIRITPLGPPTQQPAASVADATSEAATWR